jgi:hypothetical protein
MLCGSRKTGRLKVYAVVWEISKRTLPGPRDP